jgi:hypothetical protein
MTHLLMLPGDVELAELGTVTTIFNPVADPKLGVGKVGKAPI